jgi:hypothetical protein
MGSATVRWWDLPIAGTQRWFDLPDSDPRKLAAVVSAAEYHALRMETAQQARAQASQAISGAAD